MTEKRHQWASNLGFILAAAGSAVGLGNIWKFPGKVGAYGGGAFLLCYLLIVFLVGFPVMLAELSIGRATQKNVVGAFRTLNPRWRFAEIGRAHVELQSPDNISYAVFCLKKEK